MCDLLKCASTDTAARTDAPTDAARRAFLIGAASLPLAAVLADPALVRAAADRVTPISIDTKGGGKTSGVIAMPKTLPAPTVILIHEWWGLNDNIKAVAADFAEQGYIALAVDLYNGQVATEREQANALRLAMDTAWATDALASWVDFLRTHKDSTGKVGTIGWCFGGGWSLNASIAAPVDATVIYYGNVTRPAADLSALKGPVLGHFGTLDKGINADMVGGFQKEMAAAGKEDALTVHWYVADHAFANPSGARYDEEDAALAWARTLAFFRQHLS